MADRESFENLFRAYLGAGRYMEAWVVAKKAAKAFEQEPLPWMLISEVYVAQGKQEKALEELRRLLAKWPGYRPAVDRLNALQRSSGEE